MPKLNDLFTPDNPQEVVNEQVQENSPKESHLYQPATYYVSKDSFVPGSVESEFDDGTVDIMTGIGRFTRIPLQLDQTVDYPHVELGVK